MNTLGIDCSVWQDDNSTPQMMDFGKAKEAGAEFVFIKSSQGLYQDQDFQKNWENAGAAGLPRGMYHFLVWTGSVLAQAEYFAGLINAHPCELPPVLDYESRTNIPAKVTAATNCLAFCRRVEELTGKTPMIYTSPSFWFEYGSNSTDFTKYPLWIAHYNVTKPSVPAPWKNWTFWQYSSIGSGAKYGAESTYIDLDLYNGTLEELKVWAGITPPPPTIEERLADHEARIQALEAINHIYLPIVQK